MKTNQQKKMNFFKNAFLTIRAKVAEANGGVVQGFKVSYY